MTKDLFAEFPHTSAEQWMEQIVRDLKGRTAEEMSWSPDGELQISPYVHAEDIETPLSPLPAFGQWQIGEQFEISDAPTSNPQILGALEGGVESLWLRCPDDTDWEMLLKDVQLPLVQLILDFHGDRKSGIEQFVAYAETQAVSNDLRIVVTGKAEDVHESIRFCTTGKNSQTVVGSLSELLFDAGADCDWQPGHMARRDLIIHTGNHYLVEIATLRALRILWQNLAEALKFNTTSEFSIAVCTARGKGDDPYQHMIRSAFAGTAAVLGGADCVYITPAEGGDRSEAFYRHVARNISHLLRYESKFTEIPDPVAGAYYIDQLTMEIVDRVWEDFMTRTKKSGR